MIVWLEELELELELVLPVAGADAAIVAAVTDEKTLEILTKPQLLLGILTRKPARQICQTG